MRVALLTYGAQAGDAIGNQVAEKLAFFLDRGADVRVVVESDKRLHPAVRPHCQRLPGPEPQGEGWQFLSSADLVLVEYGQYYRLLELLPLLAGGKPRILFDYHGVTPPDLWEAHNREVLERGARQRGLVWCADAALAHSRFTCQELRDQTGFPAERVSILGHAVDAKQFCPGVAGRHLRDRLGLPSASLLLFVGRLAPNKRVPVLIEALDRLHDLTPPVHVVIVGDRTDVYQVEARRCRQRAAELGLADRVHLVGHVRDDQLLDAYRSANVFVMPSRHEGFCVPVIEAMACGLPVVAAGAGALPETLAGAGLTFTPDDPEDLARQVRRLLGRPDAPKDLRESEGRRLPSSPTASASPCHPRVAVAPLRYGTDFVGGAETSLRTIATTLYEAGCAVEVFTTCARSDRDWANRLSEGTTQGSGIPVHRFRVDAYEKSRQLEAVRAILQADRPVPAEAERLYLEHSVRSTSLLEALRQRIDQFDAVIVGPYLYGLTFDLAAAFPDKTILVPCFHDEPFARLRIWRPAYRAVGGILYHSPEEKDLAETEFGLSHPGAVCLGTVLDTETQGNAERGRSLVGSGGPYIVYCGRYLREKNLPALLDYARRYQEANPGRFTFVFMGQGEVSIPRATWARDLGFVEEIRKRDVLAGAAALAQLSHNESLSLAALEAWAQGIPVLAASACSVLAGHLRRCRGGRAVDGYPSFAATLDDLWQRPEAWQRRGQRGRAYVRASYRSRENFSRHLLESIRGLTVPLAERMRRQGLLCAAGHQRPAWRERFGRIVEELLDSPPRQKREQCEVRPRTPTRTVSAGSASVLVPVRVANRGTHAASSEGPGRVLLRSVVVDATGQPCGLPALETPLPGLLVPGQEVAAAMRVPVPAAAGAYRAALFAVPPRAGDNPTGAPSEDGRVDPFLFAGSWLRLTVEPAPVRTQDRCCTPSLQAVQGALAEAECKQRLPDDYTDVTDGLLASWKRWIKRKLLGNFKHAYVDVLSRQQSAFNRQVLTALQELAEGCATLDHAFAAAPAGKALNQDKRPSGPLPGSEVSSLAASIERTVAAGKADELAVLLHSLADQLAETRQRFAVLEKRLNQLEEGKRVRE